VWELHTQLTHSKKDVLDILLLQILILICAQN